MGRRKIPIELIADERNRQARTLHPGADRKRAGDSY
jgi:hypothetical protein